MSAVISALVLLALLSGAALAHAQQPTGPQPAPLESCREDLRAQIQAWRQGQIDCSLTQTRIDKEIQQQVQELRQQKLQEAQALQAKIDELQKELDALKAPVPTAKPEG